jgi:hypothetical protein
MANSAGVVSVIAGLKVERENLKRQLDKLDEALTVLGGLNGAASGSTSNGGRPRRTMSMAARRRIAAAQRARWAKVRASKNK